MNPPTKPRAPRSLAPSMCEVPGFLHALRLAREAYPSLPRGAWVAAARSRDAMHRQIIARRGLLLPVHVIDAALTALRLGAVVDTSPARHRSPPRGPGVAHPLGAA
jgi:hypothetical protein